MSALAKQPKLAAVTAANPQATVVPFSGRQVRKINLRHVGATAPPGSQAAACESAHPARGGLARRETTEISSFLRQSLVMEGRS